MMNVLIISEMTPDAPCGVVTYYKKVLDQFSADTEIKISLTTAEDASYWDKKMAGIIRKVLQLFAFVDKRIGMYADDLYYGWLIRSALRKYKNHKIDFLHAQEPRSAYNAKRFFYAHIPCILTCHFNDNPVAEDLLYYDIKKPIYERFLINKSKKQLAEIDHFIFVSRYCYSKSKHLLSDFSKVHIIHNGVDFEAVYQKKITKPPKGRLEIINTGHIEKRKNQGLLVDIAIQLIHKHFTNFHITILGTGPDLPFLTTMIEENNLESYFSLPGWVNNVDEYLDKTNLYIHTSSNDNCPYSVIEAIARKTTVLGFRVGGLTEILDDDFLFDLNDTQAITRFVFENMDHLGMMAQQQYQKINKEFSIQHQYRQLKQVYFSNQPKVVTHPVG